MFLHVFKENNLVYGSYKRNYSDGSDNSDSYDYEETDDTDSYSDRDAQLPDSYDSYESSTNNEFYYANGDASTRANGRQAFDDTLIPRVKFQNSRIRFDRITPKMISHMTDEEKNSYINVCRQLYTDIYEI
jgi:hypothetical protein